MLARRLRRRPNIITTLGERLVFAGLVRRVPSVVTQEGFHVMTGSLLIPVTLEVIRATNCQSSYVITTPCPHCYAL